MIEKIQDRIDNGLKIETTLYISGLFDIIKFLYAELNDLLKEENRFFGIVKSYSNSIIESFNRFNKTVTEEDIIIFGKILYLFRGNIHKEFKRLNSKGLSRADSVIVIINKLISIIDDVKESHPNTKEIRTVKKITQKLYDNIRNKSKLDPMYFFTNTIKECIIKGVVGKYQLDIFSIEDKIENKNILDGDGTRIDENNGQKIIVEL